MKNIEHRGALLILIGLTSAVRSASASGFMPDHTNSDSRSSVISRVTDRFRQGGRDLVARAFGHRQALVRVRPAQRGSHGESAGRELQASPAWRTPALPLGLLDVRGGNIQSLARGLSIEHVRATQADQAAPREQLLNETIEASQAGTVRTNIALNFVALGYDQRALEAGAQAVSALDQAAHSSERDLAQVLTRQPANSLGANASRRLTATARRRAGVAALRQADAHAAQGNHAEAALGYAHAADHLAASAVHLSTVGEFAEAADVLNQQSVVRTSAADGYERVGQADAAARQYVALSDSLEAHADAYPARRESGSLLLRAGHAQTAAAMMRLRGGKTSFAEQRNALRLYEAAIVQLDRIGDAMGGLRARESAADGYTQLRFYSRAQALLGRNPMMIP